MVGRSRDVFISYRRENGAAEARLVRAALIERGLTVFLDVVDLKHGHFDAALLTHIAESRVFVVILSPGCLSRCSEPHDWMRQEIVQALQTGKSIVPVMLPGFEFGANLPPEIQDLPRHQAVEYSHGLFDATIDKLVAAIGGSAERTLKPKLAYYSVVLPFWRKLGARGILPAALLVALPLCAYTLLGHAVNSTVPALVGDLGVELDAADWSVHPIGLSAVGRNVRVHAPHETDAVFTAGEVEFSGTLATVVSGLVRQLASIVTFGWVESGQPFAEIHVRNGDVHLELSLTGHLNWQDLWDGVPDARKAHLANALAALDTVTVDNVKVTYVEHVPGQSGGGVIQTAQAIVNVDEINGAMTNLAARDASGGRLARFKFSGRSADGVIAVSGQTALPEVRRASTANILLENVGAGAFAKMVPDTTGLIATQGNLRGRIDVSVSGDQYRCTSNLEMENVRFAPNPRRLLSRIEFDRLERDLASWRSSGRFDACEPFGDTHTQETGRAKAPLLMAAFNAQATTDAPASVRAVAARDEQSLAEAARNAAVADVMSKVADAAGRRVTNILGPQSGNVVRQTLAGADTGRSPTAVSKSPSQSHGDQITKPLKSVGRGFKRIFGGDKKDEPKR